MPQISKKILSTLVEDYINDPKIKVQYGLEDTHTLNLLRSIIKNSDSAISYIFIDNFINFIIPNKTYSFYTESPIFNYLFQIFSFFECTTFISRECLDQLIQIFLRNHSGEDNSDIYNLEQLNVFPSIIYYTIDENQIIFKNTDGIKIIQKNTPFYSFFVNTIKAKTKI